jgi:uncharacterized protein
MCFNYNRNDMNIIRSKYIAAITPFIGKPIIKVLTGQRRVGKSYLLLSIKDEIQKTNSKANVIYINIELLEFSFIKSHTDLYEYVNSKIAEGQKNYLFIDEVQEISSFELCLRSFLAENKCDIYCTGSNAKMLSGELATTLSGRYIQIPVYSLSYVEFLEFHKLADNNDSLVTYLKVGGMPYLIHTGLDSDVVKEYLMNLNSTILLKDVVARQNIRNVSFLENLTAFLADNTGSLINAHNITKYLKSQQQNVPTQTVLNYLQALCNAFFIHKVQRAEVNGLKIFEVNEKYYFEDLGLRNVIRSVDFRTDVNKLMENVVYLHLKRAGYKVNVGQLGKKEIDFIAEKNNERLYVQIAYMLIDDVTIQREFGNLMQINDNFPKYVVTMDDISAGESFKGIKQIHLREFLKQFN